MKIQSSAARIGAAVLALALPSLPLVAAAQDLPSYAQSADETIHGRIASVDGAFDIIVNDDRGFRDNVQLHAGTIINPTGLALASGMSVTIIGYNAGQTFDANEIDTPYTYSGPLPVPVYYGAGYWYPGFGYGYGPSFTLAFFFGNGYRFEHRPFYGRPWNGHGYFGGYVAFGYGGHGYGVHPVDGPHGYEGHRFDGAHGDAHAVAGERGHIPSGFAGRSFAGSSAGHAYAGGSYGGHAYSRGTYGGHAYGGGSYGGRPSGGFGASRAGVGARGASGSVHGGGHASGGGHAGGGRH